MNVQGQIKEYVSSQPEPKRSDMLALHSIMLETKPGCKLWFQDGKNSENKTVSNPNTGYGLHTIKYADGKTRETKHYTQQRKVLIWKILNNWQKAALYKL